MRPILASLELPLLGRLELPAFFTLVTAAFGAGLYLATREARRQRVSEARVFDLGLWLLVAGLLGARLLSVLADGHLGEYVDLCVDPRRVAATDALVARCTADAQCGYDYLCDLGRGRCHPPRDCLRALELWYGGFAFYGGFLAAAAVGIGYARRHRLGVWRIADLCAPIVALGQAIGRVGCFLEGCCHGRPTSSWLGVRFPAGSPAFRAQAADPVAAAAIAATGGRGLPVHPTQLYEAAAALGIFILLAGPLRARKRFHGELLAWLCLLYGVARGGLELVRDDDRGLFWAGAISTSQLIAAPLVLGAALVLWRRRGLAGGGPPDARAVP